MSQYYYNPFGNSDVNEEQNRQFLRLKQKKDEKREIRKISFTMGCAIVAYLLIQQVLGVFLLLVPNLKELYTNSVMFQYGLTIVGVSFLAVFVPFGIMALVNKHRYNGTVIPNTPIKAGRVIPWVCFGMICCVGANIFVAYFTTFFETLFKVEFTGGDIAEPTSFLACAVELVAVAIVPAVCEEFAMRCCSLQLLKKYGTGFAVFAVSIVFGLLHGNVVQFVFAFVIGLILGFVTIKTDSIVPAIFIHMINNGMSVFRSTVLLLTNEKTTETAVIIMYLFWLVSGAVSGIYLLLTKQFARKMPVATATTNGEKFTAFLFPWMIIPFLILIAITVTTIK